MSLYVTPVTVGYAAGEGENGAAFQINAVIDTGCSITSLREDIFNRIKEFWVQHPELHTSYKEGTEKIRTAASPDFFEVPTLEIDFWFAGAVVKKLQVSSIKQEGFRYDCLLGMDIMKNGMLQINGRKNEIFFAYRANLLQNNTLEIGSTPEITSVPPTFLASIQLQITLQ